MLRDLHSGYPQNMQGCIQNLMHYMVRLAIGESYAATRTLDLRMTFFVNMQECATGDVCVRGVL